MNQDQHQNADPVIIQPVQQPEQPFDNIIAEQQQENEEEKNQNNGQQNTNNYDANNSSKFKTLLQRIKLKVIARYLLNKTSSRIYQNLSAIHYKYIADKASHQYYQVNRKKNQSQLYNQVKPKYIILSQATTKSDEFFDKLAKLKIMKYVQNTLQKIPVINPSSSYKLIWDMLLILIIIILIFVLPIHFTFKISLNQLINPVAFQMILLIIIVDVICSLNTGYYCKGVPVLNKQAIVKNYFKNQFLIDFFSFVPQIIHEFIESHEEKEQDNDTTFVINVLQLLIFLKIKWFSETIKKFEDRSGLSRKTQNIIQLIKLFFTILLSVHIVACIWCFGSKLEQSYNLTPWNIKYINENWQSQYINSIYFSTVTMITIGYGDITPANNIEKLISVFVMIFTCGIFAYSLNEVGQVLQEFSRPLRERRQNLSVINNYMKQKNIGQQLQFQIREYLDYFWEETTGSNQEQEQKIISQLPESLRQSLLFEANKIVLIDSPIFKNNFNENVLQQTIPFIKECKFTPEEIICQEGELGSNELYFVQKGSVELYLTTNHPGCKIGSNSLMKLERGQSFGTVSFFTGMPYSCNVKSLDFTTLLRISRNDFLQIIRNFSDEFEKFSAIKDSIILYSDYSLLGVNCFSCGSSNHMFYSCPVLHFKANNDKILQLFIKSKDQLRNKDFKRQRCNKVHQIIKYRYIIENKAFEYIQKNEMQTYEQQYLYSQEFYAISANDLSNIEDQVDSQLQPQSSFKELEQKSKDIDGNVYGNQTSLRSEQSNISNSESEEENKDINPNIEPNPLSPNTNVLQHQLTLQDSQQINKSLSTSNIVFKFEDRNNSSNNNAFNKYNQTLRSSYESAHRSQKSMQKNFNQLQNIEQLILQRLGQIPQNTNPSLEHDQQLLYFDQQKHFENYFPYNNLSTVLEIIQYEIEVQKVILQRIYLDNRLYHQKSRKNNFKKNIIVKNQEFIQNFKKKTIYLQNILKSRSGSGDKFNPKGTNNANQNINNKISLKNMIPQSTKSVPCLLQSMQFSRSSFIKQARFSKDTSFQQLGRVDQKQNSSQISFNEQDFYFNNNDIIEDEMYLKEINQSSYKVNMKFPQELVTQGEIQHQNNNQLNIN